MRKSSAGNRPLAFLITAAGSGSRMGGGIKKEYRSINGKPVLGLVLETFLKTGLFDYGLITCKSGSIPEAKSMLADVLDKDTGLSIPLLFCEGGRERQESVRLGLEHLNSCCPNLEKSGCVLIHDGARPWITTELVEQVAETTLLRAACAPVIPSVNAMKEVNENGIITGHLPRKETMGVQTPQGFAFNEILAAHRRAAADGRHYIDDTEIFSRYEGDVFTVPGSVENKKITYAGDIK
ncbi:MAG: IspD/TarI family cytidylyltransferase [Spirochaetales bacterium]|uniref:IspD/TarI family cytidylyltransferase n=1 Tax=Candidatus Thalassospirochaeta sargassi TaxID=3119039 RepID=A0AAJ1MK85_9SPIO|nr:IspD/TarI family cytidylyltransferase [Spirochaetales bacterium]